MISFSPQGGYTNGTFDGCQGVISYYPSTATMGTTQNIVAMVIPTIILFICLIMQWTHRQFKTRSFGLQYLLSSGLILGLFLASFDSSAMACQLHGFLWLTHIAIILPCVTLILLVTLLRERYALSARIFERNIIRQDHGGSITQQGEAFVIAADTSSRIPKCTTITRFFQVISTVFSGDIFESTTDSSFQLGPSTDNTPNHSPRGSELGSNTITPRMKARSNLSEFSSALQRNSNLAAPVSIMAEMTRGESGRASSALSEASLQASATPGSSSTTTNIRDSMNILKSNVASLHSRHTITQDTAAETLQLLGSVKRTRTLLIWIALFYAPGLLALVVFYLVSLPYHTVNTTTGHVSTTTGHGCMGCPVYWELVIILAILGFAFSIIILRLIYLLRHAEDRLYTVRDTITGLATSGLLYILYFVMLIVTPDGSSSIAQFRWIIYSALWCQIMFTCLIPMIRMVLLVRLNLTSITAWTDLFRAEAREERKRRVSIPPLKLSDALKDPILMQSFEKFALRWYVIENLRFLEACHQFKRFFDEKNEAWRANKAKRIVELFLQEDALLQINVGQDMRVKLQNRVMEQIADPSKSGFFEVFDGAFSEVERMLSDFGGPWNLFCQQENLVAGRPVSTTTNKSGSHHHKKTSRQSGGLLAVKASNNNNNNNNGNNGGGGGGVRRDSKMVNAQE